VIEVLVPLRAYSAYTSSESGKNDPAVVNFEVVFGRECNGYSMSD
jgi:hypothetical protein